MKDEIQHTRQSAFWSRFALFFLIFFIFLSVIGGALVYWGFQKIRGWIVQNPVQRASDSIKNSVESKIESTTQNSNFDLFTYTHRISFNTALNTTKKITTSGTKLYIVATAEDISGDGGTIRVLDDNGKQIGETLTLSVGNTLSSQLHNIGGAVTQSLAAADGKFSVSPGTFQIEVRVLGVCNVQILSNDKITEK